MSNGISKSRTHAEHRLKNGRWMRRLLCSVFVAMAYAPGFVANAQSLAAQLTQLSPASFDKYRYVFAPLDINSHRNDIWLLDLAPLKILRIESADFCRDRLCLTIVTTDCGRSA